MASVWAASSTQPEQGNHTQQCTIAPKPSGIVGRIDTCGAWLCHLASTLVQTAGHDVGQESAACQCVRQVQLRHQLEKEDSPPVQQLRVRACHLLPWLELLGHTPGGLVLPGLPRSQVAVWGIPNPVSGKISCYHVPSGDNRSSLHCVHFGLLSFSCAHQGKEGGGIKKGNTRCASVRVAAASPREEFLSLMGLC